MIWLLGNTDFIDLSSISGGGLIDVDVPDAGGFDFCSSLTGIHPEFLPWVSCLAKGVVTFYGVQSGSTDGVHPNFSFSNFVWYDGIVGCGFLSCVWSALDHFAYEPVREFQTSAFVLVGIIYWFDYFVRSFVLFGAWTSLSSVTFVWFVCCAGLLCYCYCTVFDGSFSPHALWN